MSYDLERAREHFETKVDFTTGTHEVLSMIEQGRTDVVLVDVRLPSDYRTGHIPGAINLPKGRWHNAPGLSKDKLHILYCYSQTCHLAAEAAVELLRQGYRVQEMEGGYATWIGAGYPVEEKASQEAPAGVS
jgi:rhodanese-related sulfurtransferase